MATPSGSLAGPLEQPEWGGAACGQSPQAWGRSSSAGTEHQDRLVGSPADAISDWTWHPLSSL